MAVWLENLRAKLQTTQLVYQININQPSGSRPKGPWPPFKGTADKDRTHVTTDGGFCSANYAT